MNGVVSVNMSVVGTMLEEIAQDRTVPKNIRSAVEQVKASLGNAKQELAVRINSAVSILDEISGDPNIPVYSRTQIWNIVSMLEVMNEIK
ncbi:MAG: UPF0147 family protein [Candidatus Aenigmarchaeota archaeon]|nr:UPF0147 family protein [Candidatus Aenigmarchaeota archaeon]